MLLSLLVVLIIVGVLLYLFNNFVNMDARFKTAINVIVCLVAFLYVLDALTGRNFVAGLFR
jgi:hypothetical protein